MTVLEHLEGSEGSSASEHFVAQFSLVVAVLDLVISIVRFTCNVKLVIEYKDIKASTRSIGFG